MNCILNKQFWTKDNKLKPAVREVLLSISKDIINDISKDIEMDLPIHAITFTGSLTGENYDDTSDVDLHIVIDYTGLDDQDKSLLKNYLAYFAKNFSKNELTIHDHNLELYFQDKDEKHLAPGIYDIEKDDWIQPTDCIKIKYSLIEKLLARQFLSKTNDLKKEFDITDNYNLLLRKAKTLFNQIKNFRKKGLESPQGMYSKENIVFKMLRRNNTLELLTQLMHDIKQRIIDQEVGS